jgi:hypothetical protein
VQSRPNAPPPTPPETHQFHQQKVSIDCGGNEPSPDAISTEIPAAAICVYELHNPLEQPNEVLIPVGYIERGVRRDGERELCLIIEPVGDRDDSRALGDWQRENVAVEVLKVILSKSAILY